MSTITQRPCWHAEDVRYSVPIDAGAMTDELFRFVHVPGVITRRRFRGYGSALAEGTRCNEQQVLDDLLEGEAAMRVAAVVGEVGTGKSHLVRWLYIELQRRQRFEPDLAKRLHVVYVPKTRTTFKGVVDRILKDQTGVQFDEFRQRLQRAQDNFRPTSAKDRLVDGIANSIRDLASLDPSGAGSGDDQPTPADPYRQKLIEQLPDLLQDSVYRKALISEGGVIDQTIAIARDRRGTEHGLPRFTEDDLHLDLDEVTAMSRAAQRLFAKVGNDKWMRRTVDLMNEVLDGAVGTLFDIRRGEVGELLVDVRATLEQQGRELVLLVEDLTLLQGVEQELLEAIIAPKQEVDGRSLCAVRAAFAATPGHFDRMPTVRSRLDADKSFLYSLDASIQEDDELPQASLTDAVKLVGSYLNAARWGKQAIEDWAHEHPDATGVPPNRCDDCKLAKNCLAAFGASPDLDHGLYPFNATAIRRMLIGEGSKWFEPRLVLKHVLDTLRDERQALVDGKFPTDRWANLHNPSLTPIANKVQNALDDAYRSPDTARRAEHLLMFWAGATDEVVNLPKDIHDAFQIPEVPGARTVPSDATLYEDGTTTVSPPRPPARRDKPKARPPSLSPYEQEVRRIAEWRTALRSGAPENAELPAGLARDLRQALAGVLLERVPAGLEFLSYVRRDAVSDLADAIYIEGAASGNPRSDAATAMRLGAESEQVFIALRARARKADLDRAPLDALLDAVDKHVETAEVWLYETVVRRADEAAAAPVAYVGALLTGSFPDADQSLDSDRETVNAMLASAPSKPLPDELAQRRDLLALITADWKNAREVLLRTTAVKQNPTSGDPAALDATAWLKAVEAFRAANLSVGPTRVRSGLPATLSAATEALGDIVREGNALLERLAEDLDQIEDSADAEALSETFRSAIDAVGYASIDVGDLTELRNQAQTVRSIDLPELRVLAAETEPGRNRDQALRFQSRAVWRDVVALISYVDTAGAMVDGAARWLEAGDHRISPRSEYDVGPSAAACKPALIELADVLAEVRP